MERPVLHDRFCDDDKSLSPRPSLFHTLPPAKENEGLTLDMNEVLKYPRGEVKCGHLFHFFFSKVQQNERS